MSLTRRGFMWAVAALLGIAVAAAVTWSVTNLAAQRIGLSSEPLSVIHGLAPAAAGVKTVAARGDSDAQKVTARRTGSAPSTPLPVTGSVPSITATPPPGTTSAQPATAALPPATATAPRSASPALASPASVATAASAGGSGAPHRSDHPDDSSGGPHGGSNGGHSGRDD